MPDWDGSIPSLHDRLDTLFQMTPPTALIIDEPPIFFSVQQHLSRKGIQAPHQISLVCTDKDPYFKMQRPTIAHIDCDSRQWVKSILKWVSNLSIGIDKRHVTTTSARFVEGGSMGRAST